MLLLPAYKMKLVDPLWREFDLYTGTTFQGRKKMVLRLPNGLVFPAGTPDSLNYGSVNVQVFRGKVRHFHCQYWPDGSMTLEPMGRDIEGYAIAHSKRLGAGRKALRRLLANYPPVNPQVEAFHLRQLVREGD